MPHLGMLGGQAARRILTRASVRQRSLCTGRPRTTSLSTRRFPDSHLAISSSCRPQYRQPLPTPPRSCFAIRARRTYSSTAAASPYLSPEVVNDPTQYRYDLRSIVAKLYRHNIEPDGKVGGMRNLLGQEAKGDEIVFEDTPLPINLSADFLLFLKDNMLPNGRASPLPGLTPEEIKLLWKPYSEWAPAPYNKPEVPSTAAGAIFLFSFTGTEDLFDLDAMFSGGEGIQLPHLIEHELFFNKQRVWGGLVPLSDQRWREKGFDQIHLLPIPARDLRFAEAMDHLDKASTFLCFNLPDVWNKMRKSYNRAYSHLAHFDTVLAAYYDAKKPQQNTPPRSVRGRAADLWAEFFFSRVEYMLARNHQWYTTHANALKDEIIEEIRDIRGPPPRPDEENPVEVALQKFDMLLQHRIQTETILLLPLGGFLNTLPHWQHVCAPPSTTIDPHQWIEQQVAAAGKLPIPSAASNRPDAGRRSVLLRNRQSHLLTELVRASNPSWLEQGALQGSPQNSIYMIQQTWKTADQAVSELRGTTTTTPTPITEELWISSLRASLARHPPTGKKPYTRWGWIGFRLCYSHTDEQWALFRDRVHADIDDGWSTGILGAQAVKSTCQIHWLDGRDFGIPENDIVAARAQLKSLIDARSALVEGMVLPPAFLVADQESIDSYLSPPTLPGQDLISPCDLKSHVVVAQSAPLDVAAAATRPANQNQKQEAPAGGYEGTVHVPGGLLMGDVFPGLFMSLYQLKDIWNMAAAHPAGLYLGPYAQYQEFFWGQFKKAALEVFKAWNEKVPVEGEEQEKK